MGVPVAPAEAVIRILQRDPEAIWVFETDGRITGGVAFLFLSQTGVEHLVAGRFNPHAPSEEYLVEANEKPAGVYFWGIYREDPTSGGIRETIAMLDNERFKDASLWTFPTGESGRAFFARIGLRPFKAAVPNLYGLIRGQTGPEFSQAA